MPLTDTNRAAGAVERHQKSYTEDFHVHNKVMGQQSKEDAREEGTLWHVSIPGLLTGESDTLSRWHHSFSGRVGFFPW